MKPNPWLKLMSGLALAAPIPYVAHATTYLTEQQAAAALFPGVKLKPVLIELSKEEAKAIEKASGEKVRETKLRVFWGPKREALIVDNVIGKHEFITYAVAIGKTGHVKGVEILDYRETYGYEIRQKEWRNQFIGKNAASALKLDKDITNISGATLSSAHVTGGVRRTLATYELIKAKR